MNTRPFRAGLSCFFLMLAASTLLFVSPKQIAGTMPSIAALGTTLQVFASGGSGTLMTALITTGVSLLALIGAWRLAAVRLRSTQR